MRVEENLPRQCVKYVYNGAVVSCSDYVLLEGINTHTHLI